MRYSNLKCDTAAGQCQTASAWLTMETLHELDWETLKHPAYSPDLSPYDYYSFGLLKDALGRQRFASDDEGGIFCERMAT